MLNTFENILKPNFEWNVILEKIIKIIIIITTKMMKYIKTLKNKHG